MTDDFGIKIFFSSKTIGGFKGRKGLEPVCHSCDKKLGVVKSSELREAIPSEVMSMVFSAELACQELGVDLKLVDITRLNTTQRIKERLNGKPIPRVSLGEEFITGSLSKDEIIRFYRRVCE
ncbi:MAG: hypothetical protein RTV72_06885 [Candidatus Thorarchaeota archaeon]